MAEKLVIIMVNTDPKNGEELGAPFFQATVAAAMDYEVEVICTATAGRLMKKGVAQDWTGLAGPGRTLAIYMGLGTAQAIADKLVVDGFDPATPVAVVENGTRADERRFYGPLSHLPRLVADHQVASPALIIVGEVAALAKDWPADALAPLKAAAADIEPLKIAV